MITFIKQFFGKLVEQAKMAEHSFMVILAVIIGVLGGLGALGVRLLIQFFTDISFGGEEIIKASEGIPWYQIIITLAIGGAIIGPIIYFFAKEAKGHGVPEVMESIAKRDGMIRPRVVLVKALASSICIGTGGSTGREGPIVQIGASIGSAIGQILKLPSNKLKTLVACGAAAGIAATFNAPIAGALFAVEIILGDFGVAQFSPIVISSVIATVVSRHFLGDFPTFEVLPYELKSAWELIPYALLGLLGGAAGVLFIKVLYGLEDFFDGIRIPDYVKPAIGGALVGLVAIAFPEVLGIGHEAVNHALHGGLVWYIMAAMVLIKILGTSLTLGSGGSGGIFAPSLFIGAMLGGAFGTGVHALFPGITASSGTYSLVAMGTVVASATQAPITAILIIFELTNDYNIILPLMVACITSTLFARKLKKESIYTLKLLRKGINIEAGREIDVLKDIKTKSVMEHNKAVILSSMKLEEILNIVVNTAHTCFVVIDPESNLLGSFTLHDFKQILIDYEDLKDVLIATDMVKYDMIFVKEEDNLNYVMSQFGKGNTDELPVLDQDEKRVIGVIWKNDVINSYNRELLKAEIANGMAERVSSIERLEMSEVIPGYSMLEIPVPKKFIGETLIGVNVRAKYLVEVILIKTILEKSEKESRIFPYGDYRFKAKDKLLLFGENSKIQRIKNL
ncbi:MAG TPA: CBS domain-containing protein [Spirochaetes bacterium]|nr:CBS domain-containing protein [Spirochaetota bacterium]